MTIIDFLFFASDCLSWDVSWEYIAKLLVAWLYILTCEELEEQEEYSSFKQSQASPGAPFKYSFRIK